MSVRICHLLEHLNRLAPPELAEAWDNVGLLVGARGQEVENVLVCLDVTRAAIHEAMSKKCQAIVSHHPPIFKPLARIDLDEASGAMLRMALVHDLALIACHTNLDSAKGGVSDALARALGLGETRPLQSVASYPDAGLGRIGRFAEPIPAKEFLCRVASATANRALPIAGRLPETVTTVAVCGGSGSEFAPLALRLGADVYLSAEIKHSTALWARENDFCLIDGGHWGTERLAVDTVAAWLENLPGIAVHRAESERPAFNLINS